MAGSRRVIQTAFLACGMAAMAGCGSQSAGDGTGGGSGSPGTTGSGGRGGTTASGGTGGTPATGGRGGASASGGSLGTGGTKAGAGGSSASGGSIGTGGTRAGAGGSSASGGRGGTAGAGIGGHAGTGAGGSIGTGATGGAAGARASGGHSGSGAAGAPGGGGHGGTSASGGTTGRGGATGTGGSPAGGGSCGERPVTGLQALQASGWGSGPGIDVSFNVLDADSSVARRAFQNNGDSPDCDTSPVPLPAGGAIEGHSDYHCSDGEDCHLLVYQGSRLYELYQADVSTGSATGGTFSGGCLVVWDLTHDYWQPAAPPNFSRGDHCNGADAADMPIAPLLLTADDIKSGEVAHALRFTIPNPHIRAGVYVHPATHIGGPTGGSDQLPYGARLRLRKDFDLSSLPSEPARMVARALQRYGMFLADGGNLYISGTTDLPDVISTQSIRSIKATDFEMVDGGQRIDWSSYQCKRTVISN